MLYRLGKYLYLIMGIYAGLILFVNTDITTFKLDTSKWIDYVFLLLFYFLLMVFWKTVKKAHEYETQKAVSQDDLTGLATTGHFFKVLGAEIDRSRRRSYNLSTLLLDIDYFHRYNQVHGIKDGNRVLKTLGTIIKKSTRKYDSGFRFGNDEFAIILPETDRIQAKMISERLRESFANSFGGDLGLSIGVASFDKEDDVDRMLQKSQAAMEDARRGGGNRTRAYIERGQL